MVSKTDPEYLSSREIKRGNAKMPAKFVALAEWIDDKYGVRPLNICYDLAGGDVEKPRLQVIFEYEAEKALFQNQDSWRFNRSKQKAISKQYQAMFRNSNQRSGNFAEKPFVTFSAFDRLARIEANEGIPREAIDKLKGEINYEGLWLIHPMFSSANFFVYTDQQVHECVLNGQKDLWTEEYFQLLKTYDEFNYFKREGFTILIDSKENLDKNYQGNWYYYYK